MISDEDIQKLPDDPKLAFAKFVRLLREVVDRDGPNKEDYSIERAFANHVRAFADTHDVGIKIDPSPAPDIDFSNFYKKLIDSLDYITTKSRLETLRGSDSMDHGQIELSDDYRSQIHRHLIKVRKIINAVEIEDRLRENIFKRLNALAAEVDKSRSGLMRFADAYIEITAAIGDGFNNLEPAVKVMERIGGIFGKARKECDVKQISGGEEKKLITGPADAAHTDDIAEKGDIDDEIPF